MPSTAHPIDAGYFESALGVLPTHPDDGLHPSNIRVTMPLPRELHKVGFVVKMSEGVQLIGPSVQRRPVISYSSGGGGKVGYGGDGYDLSGKVSKYMPIIIHSQKKLWI